MRIPFVRAHCDISRFIHGILERKGHPAECVGEGRQSEENISEEKRKYRRKEKEGSFRQMGIFG